jgi:glucose-6-phosphate isomerase
MYADLFTRFNPLAGTIVGLPSTVRRLSDLQDSFADLRAYHQALAEEDRVVYVVSAAEYPSTEGQLNYAIGLIMPGKIGCEYHLTKGHYHAWRSASEIYIGLVGEGGLLLENEADQETQFLPLLPNTAVAVPGFTAHRTVNVGPGPLAYLGIYPAQAGHDYDSIAQKNFHHVIVESEGKPVLMNRQAFLSTIIPK